MDTNRRNFLMTGLFGAGWVGLRALATGLPTAYFLNPSRALADTPPPACAAAKNSAQYLILSIDQNGDPINANAPGTYDADDIVHPNPADGSFNKTAIKLGTQTVNGPAIWGTLPQWVLDRTCFFHLATQTTIHPDLPKVLSLMGAAAGQEMLPSIAAYNLASCLGTVQAAPVSLVGTEASEYVTYQGRVLPNLNAVALRDILTHPAGPLTQLMQIRDSSMDQIWARLKASSSATSAQKSFIDSLSQSRQQARSISDSLLNNLGNITTNDASGQALAAAALIKMNITPAVVIRIPFGGDNHFDQNLVTEAQQTASSTPVNGGTVVNSGVPLIGALFENLQSMGIQDQVTFASLNVFGRTLKSLGEVGRNHWADHHVSILIGPKVKAGVVGGVVSAPSKGDYVALPIDSGSGMGTPNGDLQEGDLLGSLGKTLCAAMGVPQQIIDQSISSGKVVAGALTS
jgi:hypothetical protein